MEMIKGKYYRVTILLVERFSDKTDEFDYYGKYYTSGINSLDEYVHYFDIYSSHRDMIVENEVIRIEEMTEQEYYELFIDRLVEDLHIGLINEKELSERVMNMRIEGNKEALRVIEHYGL